MSRTRGRRAALISGILGLTAITAGLWLLQDHLWACWYVRQLRSEDPQARKSAVEQLGALHLAFTAPAMLELAGKDGSLRNELAQSLARTGRAGVPYLLEGLDTPVQERFRVAADALLQLEPTLNCETRQRLRLQLAKKGGCSERIQSLKSLARLGPLPDAAIESMLPNIQRRRSPNQFTNAIAVATEQLLGAQGARAAQAVPFLLQDYFLYQHPHTHDALVAIGDPSALALRHELSHADADHRRKAAELLGDIGPAARAAVPLLLEMLKDSSEEVRGTVIAALGAIGPNARGAAPHLQRIFDDPKASLAILSAAYRALRRIGQ